MISAEESAGRRRLSVEHIIDAALDLARRDGVAGLSMRRLAGELGVQAMSLYHHVPSKASLLALMADRSVSQMSQPDPSWPWHRQLTELMVQMYLSAVQNPALLAVVSSEPIHPETVPAAHQGTGRVTMGLLEDVLQLLEQGQVPTAVRVHAFRGLVAVVIGFVVGTVDGLLPPPAARDQPTTADRKRQADRTPLLAAISPELDASDPVDGVRFTLQQIVANLGRLTAAARPPVT